MLVTTVSTSKASNVAQLIDLCLWRQQAIAKPPVFAQARDFANLAHAPTPGPGWMLIATVSTCKAFSFSQLHD